MATTHHITARVFGGYLQCKTKGQLLARSAGTGIPDFAEPILKQFKMASVALIEKSTSRRLIRYDELAERVAAQDGQHCLVDCDMTYVDQSQLVGVQQFRKGSKSERDHFYLPVLFIPYEPVQPWHKTLLCFSAIAICQIAHTIPLFGYVCFGYTGTLKKLRISDAIKKTIQVLEEAEHAVTSKAEASLILNKHCTICEFRARCRRILGLSERASIRTYEQTTSSNIEISKDPALKSTAPG
jgi:hypothetical protein